jgi:hypothetical protein
MAPFLRNVTLHAGPFSSQVTGAPSDDVAAARMTSPWQSMF